MAGAIAGTALVNYAPETSKKLSTVTLTINNFCNLKCPHCYLQYDGDSKIITDDVVNQLFKSEFNHLVIVGKEPFANNKSISLVDRICREAKSRNISIGVISNGHGLHQVGLDTLNLLDYVDISFDGGAKSYAFYRKGDFNSLMQKISMVQKALPNLHFNALNVLNNATLGNLDDMLDIKNYATFRSIMFSPYLETQNDGVNYVAKVRLRNLLLHLSGNQQFMNTKEAFLLLDTYHLWGDLSRSVKYSEQSDPSNLSNIASLISYLELAGKVKLIEKDPIHHGFLRLTYDGYILSPYDSLNPKHYTSNGSSIHSVSLNQFFQSHLGGINRVNAYN